MSKVILAGSACLRCGRDRIVSRVWVEKVDRGSPMTHTEAVCPDSACQKIVDAEFELKRQKRLKFAR